MFREHGHMFRAAAISAPALIAGAASGGVSHLRTSVAMTAKDAMKAFKSAWALSSHSNRRGGNESPWV
jgi:hypothetical protein